MNIDVPDFLAFCDSKGDEKFTFRNNHNCALAQYLQSKGFPKVWVGGWTVKPDGIHEQSEIDIPGELSLQHATFAEVAEATRKGM